MPSHWRNRNPKLDVEALCESGTITAEKPRKAKRRVRVNLLMFLALLMVAGWVLGLEIARAIG